MWVAGWWQNILHTWVSPVDLVRFVLHQLGSSLPPLLSEGAALLPLFPKSTTKTCASKLLSSSSYIHPAFYFWSRLWQTLWVTFYCRLPWARTRPLHFWPQMATSLWSSSVWRWRPWASLLHLSPYQCCTAWRSSHHVGNGSGPAQLHL